MNSEQEYDYAWNLATIKARAIANQMTQESMKRKLIELLASEMTHDYREACEGSYGYDRSQELLDLEDGLMRSEKDDARAKAMEE